MKVIPFFRNVCYDLKSATSSTVPLRDLQTSHSLSVLPDFSLLVRTLRSGDRAVSIATRLRNGCLLFTAGMCYRLRKGDMARRQARSQAGSSVFTYSISKVLRTTSTVGLVVSSRIWDTFQRRMCAVRNLSPEMLHVYILHSLTFHSLVVSISTGRFNTKTSELRTNSIISLYSIN